MVDKGFSNVYLLSGGFEEFAVQFPKLLEGKKAETYQAKSLGKTMGGKKSMETTKQKKEFEVTGKVTDKDHKGGIQKRQQVTGKVTDPKMLINSEHNI
jgi:hypothetical protein